MKEATSELKTTLIGRLLVATYGRVPLKGVFLRWVTRLEGGEFVSGSLRRVLANRYGIYVGAHSYGSLLTPGMSDRHLHIGRYVSIGPNVRRFGAAHPVEDLTMHPYWYNSALGFVDQSHDVKRSELVIEAESWIGANVTILPNCERIGIGAIIGAGSVVTRDVPDFAVVAGNPARQIASRLTGSAHEALLLASPWNFPPEEAARVREAIMKVEI